MYTDPVDPPTQVLLRIHYMRCCVTLQQYTTVPTFWKNIVCMVLVESTDMHIRCKYNVYFLKNHFLLLTTGLYCVCRPCWSTNTNTAKNTLRDVCDTHAVHNCCYKCLLEQVRVVTTTAMANTTRLRCRDGRMTNSRQHSTQSGVPLHQYCMPFWLLGQWMIMNGL